MSLGYITPRTPRTPRTRIRQSSESEQTEQEKPYTYKRSLVIAGLFVVNYFLNIFANFVVVKVLSDYQFGQFNVLLSQERLLRQFALLGSAWRNLALLPKFLSDESVNASELISFNLYLVSSLCIIFAILFSFTSDPLVYNSYLVPLSAFNALTVTFVVGFGFSISANVVERALRPLLILAGFGLLLYSGDSGDSSVEMATIVYSVIWSITVVFFSVFTFLLMRNRSFRLQSVSLQNAWSFFTLGMPPLFYEVTYRAAGTFSLMLESELDQKTQSEYPKTYLATYGIVNNLTHIFYFLFMGVVMNYALPRISLILHDRQQSQQLLNRLFVITGSLSTVILLIFIFGGRSILKLFGENYAVGYSSLLILCIGNIAHLTFGVSTHILILSKLFASVIVAHFLMLVTSVGLGVWLIPYLGMEGAALALSLPLFILYISMGVLMAFRLRLYAIPPLLLGIRFEYSR
jgi:O-antigen/teichoic acid export membrane protein